VTDDTRQGILYTGVPSKEELARCPGVPPLERQERGRVAVIECVQEIPCNPCEGACSFGAITVGREITNLPVLDADRCTGCGVCIARCPGLAITVVNRAFSESEATVDFPHEYLPLPAAGDKVIAVSREGETVCEGRVVRVIKPPAPGATAVVSMAIPKEYAGDVRGMRRPGVSHE
jgi:Fe-S-cluster-containing hydrogenase component 2